MKTKDRLELAHWVASTAKANGATEIAVDIANSRGVEVEYRDGQLDKIKESTQNSLNINVYADNKFSGHSTNDLRRDSLGKFVKEAIAMTKYLTEDKFRQLPDSKYYQNIKDVELDIIDNDYDSIDANQRVKYARDLQSQTAAKSDKIISSTAGYYDNDSESVKVHSNGFEGIRRQTSFSIGVEVTVADKDGKRPSDWNYATTRYLKDSPDLDVLSSGVLEKALAKVGQEKVASGTYDMVIHNRAGGKPIYPLLSPMGARAIQQKRSFLDGMKGEKIASDKFTLIDDPFIKRGMGSRHYDSEGISTRNRTLVKNGVLQDYLIDSYYGRKLGWEPTGGSTTNLVFEYGDQSLEEIIKSISHGILVTSFMGGNTNGTTGDYSWGVAGQLIENGQIVKPVSEMNISGNLIELWSSLVAMGNDPYMYSSVRRPSMMFKDIKFSGL